MSKKVKENSIDMDFKGKTNEELQETLELLEKQAVQYQTMTVKAHGAIEVLKQIITTEESKESDES